MPPSAKIPNRSVYKAAEVCAVAELQPYVLRSWEAEFPDLGVAQGANGQRVYRRSDLDRVLRIKELLFVEGLTLGAARRKMLKEAPSSAKDEGLPPLPFDELLGADTRGRVEEVKAGLRSILTMLSEGSSADAVPSAGSNGKRDTVAAKPKRAPAARKTAGPRQAATATKAPRRKKA
jgi:DNA-binding transcriptional MerR regulator